MPIYNKVTVNNDVIIDLSQDTVTDASHILSGHTGHLASGNVVTGTLVIQHYYTGSSAPSSSLGANGDIYLQS